MQELATTRVDRWLWAVRVFKTRTDATDACRGGHVRVNGASAKPSSPVRVGDQVQVRAHGRERDLAVERIIDKRVGASIATGCYADKTPPRAPVGDTSVFVRDRGSGRPTKRDRRALDRFRSG